jgi:hypothetical protein
MRSYRVSFALGMPALLPILNYVLAVFTPKFVCSWNNVLLGCLTQCCFETKTPCIQYGLWFLYPLMQWAGCRVAAEAGEANPPLTGPSEVPVEAPLESKPLTLPAVTIPNGV